MTRAASDCVFTLLDYPASDDAETFPTIRQEALIHGNGA